MIVVIGGKTIKGNIHITVRSEEEDIASGGQGEPPRPIKPFNPIP